MTYMEERILIKTYTPICKNLICEIIEYHDGYVDEEEICSLTRERCDYKKCKDKVFGGMTRQKAIEVMAKEIYKRRWIESECKNKNSLGFSICKDYAEIALNALLGVEK